MTKPKKGDRVTLRFPQLKTYRIDKINRGTAILRSYKPEIILAETVWVAEKGIMTIPVSKLVKSGKNYWEVEK